MALTQAITKARRGVHQRLAEARMSEQLDIEYARQILEDYQTIDAKADTAFAGLARIHYSLCDSEAQKDSFARVFAEYLRDEQDEDRFMVSALNHNTVQRARFRQQTPLFVEGSFTPDGSDGAA